MKPQYYPKTFSPSEKSEIIRSYKLAKDPNEQISILAELNACDNSSIVAVLKEAGLLDTADNIKTDHPVHTKDATLHESDSSRMRWTSENIAKLLSLRSENKTYKEISEYFGISITQVAGALQRYKNSPVSKCANNVDDDSPIECTEACENSESKYTLMDKSIINPLKLDISEIKTRLSDLLEFNFDDVTLSDVYKLGIDMGQLYNIVKRAEERLADVN